MNWPAALASAARDVGAVDDAGDAGAARRWRRRRTKMMPRERTPGETAGLGVDADGLGEDPECGAPLDQRDQR